MRPHYAFALTLPLIPTAFELSAPQTPTDHRQLAATPFEAIVPHDHGHEGEGDPRSAMWQRPVAGTTASVQLKLVGPLLTTL